MGFANSKDNNLAFFLDMIYLTHNKCINQVKREIYIESCPFK